MAIAQLDAWQHSTPRQTRQKLALSGGKRSGELTQSDADVEAIAYGASGRLGMNEWPAPQVGGWRDMALGGC